jgi:BRCA1-associated protein
MTPDKFRFAIVNLVLPAVIVEFPSQFAADHFYMHTLGEPFSRGRPLLRCISLFLASVAPSVGFAPVSTLDEQWLREFVLPLCPICFELFDPVMSTLFSSASEEDVGDAAFIEWGDPPCRACRARREVRQCSSCGEREKLWVCVECGHVGCERDKNRHAVLHYEATRHRFACRSDSRWLWDYTADRSVERSFHARPAEANEDVIKNYRTFVLDRIAAQMSAESDAIQNIHFEIDPEIAMLEAQLRRAESEELEVIEEFRECQETDRQLDSVEPEIECLKNSTIVAEVEHLKKREKELTARKEKLDARAQELFRMLENRSDVSGSVTVDLG